MANNATTREPLSLWECLHDGSLERIEHNALARTLLLRINVPYIWRFHHLPEQTRFELVLHDTVRLQAMDYQLWPGTSEPSHDLSWEEETALRQERFSKGSQTSRDWLAFVKSVEESAYEISDASLLESYAGERILIADLSNYSSNDYLAMRVAFNEIRVALTPDKNLPIEDFLAMGAAYWEDFANRSAAMQPAAQV